MGGERLRRNQNRQRYECAAVAVGEEAGCGGSRCARCGGALGGQNDEGSRMWESDAVPRMPKARVAFASSVCCAHAAIAASGPASAAPRFLCAAEADAAAPFEFSARELFPPGNTGNADGQPGSDAALWGPLTQSGSELLVESELPPRAEHADPLPPVLRATTPYYMRSPTP